MLTGGIDAATRIKTCRMVAGHLDQIGKRLGAGSVQHYQDLVVVISALSLVAATGAQQLLTREASALSK
ncbi:hypothetical protein G6F40_018208 [Rhizopus arrhizus]|nr:hypothetical protein G6F40_018208 [Rhizopus arrhizus]